MKLDATIRRKVVNEKALLREVLGLLNRSTRGKERRIAHVHEFSFDNGHWRAYVSPADARVSNSMFVNTLAAAEVQISDLLGVCVVFVPVPGDAK